MTLEVTTPGLVNAHTHVYSALAALGLPAPDPKPSCFVEILERVWWRLDRALDADSLRASARLYVAEALLHGTTALVDHHESPECIDGSLDVIADACAELGIRAFLCYGATERNGGRAEAQAGLAECRRFLRTNQRPNVRGLVGLHASFTVGEETLDEAAALCRELGAPMHVHVAEDRADIANAKLRGWAGPYERLLLAGALPTGSVLAHGVHLTIAQVRDAAARGLWLVHNPRSNAANAVGWAGALAASDRVALGTDGFLSDLQAEDEALREMARAHAAPLDAVAGRLVRGLTLACELAGSRAPAEDRVEWRDDAPHLARRVIVDGRAVVENGRLVAADVDAIRADAARAAAGLRTRMEALA